MRANLAPLEQAPSGGVPIDAEAVRIRAAFDRLARDLAAGGSSCAALKELVGPGWPAVESAAAPNGPARWGSPRLRNAAHAPYAGAGRRASLGPSSERNARDDNDRLCNRARHRRARRARGRPPCPRPRCPARGRPRRRRPAALQLEERGSGPVTAAGGAVAKSFAALGPRCPPPRTLMARCAGRPRGRADRDRGRARRGADRGWHPRAGHARVGAPRERLPDGRQAGDAPGHDRTRETVRRHGASLRRDRC
jgi:hypothetical protein